MRKSPVYQEILQQGMRQAKQETVIRQLRRRIGLIFPDLQAQIKNLSIQQLDNLSEVLLDFTDVSDLVFWLEYQVAAQMDHNEQKAEFWTARKEPNNTTHV